MFNIGFGELMVVGIVMLFVIGPERMPALIRVISKRLAGLFAIYTQFKQDVIDELKNQ